MLIVFMAVIDLFTCMLIIPMTAFFEYTEYRLKSDILCRMYHFLITSKVPLSLFIMVVIAIDRYMCICRPLHKLITRARAKVIIVTLAVVACALGAVSAVFHGLYQVFETLDLKRIDQKAGTNFSLSTTFILREDILRTLHMKNFSFPDCPLEILSEDYQDRQNYLQAVSRQAMCELKSLPKLPPIWVNVGVCDPSFIYLSESIFYKYQTAYNCIFPVCLLVVSVLYLLIYRFMWLRRERKLRQKLILCSYVNGDGTFENTRLVSTPPGPDGHADQTSFDKQLAVKNGGSHVRPTSESQILCLNEDSDAGCHRAKTNCEDKRNSPTPGTEHNSPVALLNHTEAAVKLSRPNNILDDDLKEKYGQNLMAHVTDSVQPLRSQHPVQNWFFSPDEIQPKLQMVAQDKNHLSAPDSHHTNNNYRKDRSPSPEHGCDHELSFANKASTHTSFSRLDLFEDENSSRSDMNSSRRASHSHAKKYQRHKKRDSMRRYKGRSHGDQPHTEREQPSRRRSPLALEADRLSKENRKANVRTALMLFTVTVMFIVAYTPGWLMSLRIVPYNKLVFFLYFSYNAANPFIYAFMNHVFKSFMYKMFACNKAHQIRI